MTDSNEWIHDDFDQITVILAVQYDKSAHTSASWSKLKVMLALMDFKIAVILKNNGYLEKINGHFRNYNNIQIIFSPSNFH